MVASCEWIYNEIIYSNWLHGVLQKKPKRKKEKKEKKEKPVILHLLKNFKPAWLH